jgi:cytochrome c-type protein NapB
MIGLVIALMAALVVIAGQSLTAGREPARVPPGEAATPTLPSEAGMYSQAARAVDHAALPREPNRKRTRAVYYARRAEPGAPPVIPHPVDGAEAAGEVCLACHGDGGWVPRFAAYTPVTPHPELAPCQSCHEPQGTPSASPPPAPPPLRRAAMPGSPPPIPHTLEMRENCRACHAGPGAVDEFRTSHPERVSCRQCHALGSRPVEAFTRPPDGGGR